MILSPFGFIDLIVRATWILLEVPLIYFPVSLWLQCSGSYYGQSARKGKIAL